jgi:hypothetical protein
MRPYLIILGVISLVFIGVIAFKYLQPSADRIASVAIMASNKNDPSICNKLSAHETKVDPSIGRTIDMYPRDECLMNYLRNTKDRTVCDLLNTEGNKYTCYNFIADVYKDPAACQKLDGTPSSWKSIPICLAVAKRDVRECDVLDEEAQINQLQYSPKTDCILEVVRRTKDYTICSGITGFGYGSFDAGGDSDRNECLKIGGCDKPDKRQVICSLMKYPSWTLKEEKDQCLTETWKCPGT